MSSKPMPIANQPTKSNHFQVCHIKDSIVRAEEVQQPRCEKHGIFQKNVGVPHQNSKHCIKWTKWRTERNGYCEQDKTLFFILLEYY
jgi:hypothetical protein